VTPGPAWWRQAVVYQVYPRSFADSDADGIGDLAGVTARVDYLAELGIDAVWLSPFYPSALADGGYDVDDYRDVDPRLGTLADFDALVAALHRAGIKVVVDVVPNHSSNRHAWFREALASPPGSPARNRYFFRDGTGPDGSEPPSDWRSVFGGPAWTRVPDGQWYLHIFAAEQPDLNWDDPEVRADFLTTLRFWSDRGVDGYRVDAAIHLGKDLSEPLPAWADLPDPMLPHGRHPYSDRDVVHEIYAQWRRVLNEYDPPRFAVAEAFAHESRLVRYADSAGLGQVFNFALLEATWDASAFRRVIERSLALADAVGRPTNWVLSNHDVVRHATRYGGGPVGVTRARAATLAMLALPGSSYLYQGEELGLESVDVPEDLRQDPAWFRTGEFWRDHCRVPMPWRGTKPPFGFGGRKQPWLPMPESWKDLTVEAQTGKRGSTLELYRKALKVRRTFATTAPREVEILDRAKTVLAFRRGPVTVVLNAGNRPVSLPKGKVLVNSGRLVDGKLPPNTAVWIR
jgi:alpha-glucosidase